MENNKAVIRSLLLSAKALLDEDILAAQQGQTTANVPVLIECRNLVEGLSKTITTENPDDLRAAVEHASSALAIP